MTDWYVGQKIVCIKQGEWIMRVDQLPSLYPEYNKIYTIKEIVLDIIIGTSFILNELENDYFWSSKHFKLLPEFRNDISIFEENLLKLDKNIEELV